jgi:hypothetical protein
MLPLLLLLATIQHAAADMHTAAGGAPTSHPLEATMLQQGVGW